METIVRECEERVLQEHKEVKAREALVAEWQRKYAELQAQMQKLQRRVTITLKIFTTGANTVVKECFSISKGRYRTTKGNYGKYSAN